MIIIESVEITIELIVYDQAELQLICHTRNQKTPIYFTAVGYSFYINKSNTLIITELQLSDYFTYNYGNSSIQFTLSEYGKLKII